MRSMLEGYASVKLYTVVRWIHCQLILRMKQSFHLMAMQILKITDPGWQILTK